MTVRTGEDTKGCYIEVEDNGVGMSVNVLTGAFLDFGTSFWGSSSMHSEFPGLESKGFSSTGKYGVGFFSTFMWGDEVSVATRRFEDSRSSTKVLSFEKGLMSRPILRKAD
ncbi:ATP-binding protein, partial [Vibrio parahaemolyticus]